MAGLGRLVKQRREALGMSQEDLAKAAGVDRSYISQIENDKIDSPSKAVLFALARELELPLREVIEAAFLPPEPVGQVSESERDEIQLVNLKNVLPEERPVVRDIIQAAVRAAERRAEAEKRERSK